jgi:hypothetical protein
MLLMLYILRISDDGVVIRFAESIVKFVEGSAKISCSSFFYKS